MAIRRIPRQDTASVTSSSSIVTPASVVKELMDNAIDAFHKHDTKAQISIEVDSSTGGLLYISVKDNGSGINKNDIPLVCLNSTTSKISSFQNIKDGIETCGFRGEALFFISNLAGSLEFTTRTKDDITCERWSVNNKGLPTHLPESIAGPVGTTVKVRELFGNNPPRKQYLKRQSRKSIENITHLVYSYSLSYRNIRFQLKFVSLLPNNLVKIEGQGISLVNKLSPLKLLGNLLKLKNNSSLFESSASLEIEEDAGDYFPAKVYLVLPKMRAQDSDFSKKGIKVITVNNRPLSVSLSFGKLITKLLKSAYTEIFLLPPPVWFMSIVIPISKIDVNIEPEKNDILVSDESKFLNALQVFVTNTVKKNHDISADMNLGADLANGSSSSISHISGPPIQSSVDGILQDDNDEDDIKFLKDLHFGVQKIGDKVDKVEDYSGTNKLILTDNHHLPEHHLERVSNTKSNEEQGVRNTSQNNIRIADSGSNLHSNETSHVNSRSSEPGNDWSYSMIDELRSSSNVPSSTIDSSSQNVPSEAEELQQLRDITISNPWTLSKMAHEMKKRKNDVTNNVLPTPETTYEAIDAPKSIRLTSNTSNHIASGSKSKKRSSKQQPILRFSKLPKLSAFSQNTVNLETTIDRSTINFFLGNHALLAEHDWVKRKGNPSEALTSGFLVVLNQLEACNHLAHDDLIISKNDENLFRVDV